MAAEILYLHAREPAECPINRAMRLEEENADLKCLVAHQMAIIAELEVKYANAKHANRVLDSIDLKWWQFWKMAW